MTANQKQGNKANAVENNFVLFLNT